jgi:hypothetical protein
MPEKGIFRITRFLIVTSSISLFPLNAATSILLVVQVDPSITAPYSPMNVWPLFGIISDVIACTPVLTQNVVPGAFTATVAGILVPTRRLTTPVVGHVIVGCGPRALDGGGGGGDVVSRYQHCFVCPVAGSIPPNRSVLQFTLFVNVP